MDLKTIFGQGKLPKSFTIIYLLVDAATSYFALIGRKTLNKLRAIVSTPHLTMKFPTLIRKETKESPFYDKSGPMAVLH